MNIGVNDGHTITGIGSGAVGRINESEHTRKVGAEVRKLIAERGHNAINCTVDYANTVTESLELVVQQANRQDLDWFIAIHFNAGGGKGVEAYTYEGRQYQDAIDVCNNISQIGFNNRGVKAGTGLYVIRRTKAKSILIEVCFVDTEDANKYLELGATALAKCIVDGLSGYIGVSNIPVAQTIQVSAPVASGGDDWIRRLQNECNAQGFSSQRIDGIAGSNTLDGCPLVKLGANGNITKLLQEKLVGLGYSTNGIDGQFGGGTLGAVQSFQKKNNLTDDGQVGKKTWSKLLGL